MFKLSLFFVTLFPLIGGCAVVMTAAIPGYPDFPRHQVGYVSTECSYTANKSGYDVNGKYTVHTESTKVTAGYADDCRPKNQSAPTR